MKQPEDKHTAELPGLGVDGRQHVMSSLAELRRKRDELQHKIDHPGRGRKPGQRIGAYRGAAKVGCMHMALRVRTGLSQADFARLAGISERTCRTWELQDPKEFGYLQQATRHAIIGALNEHGISYLAECQRHLQRTGRTVKYRCPMTGSTWSGKGLKPVWLRVALDRGAKLADFVVATETGKAGRPVAALLRAPA